MGVPAGTVVPSMFPLTASDVLWTGPWFGAMWTLLTSTPAPPGVPAAAGPSALVLGGPAGLYLYGTATPIRATSSAVVMSPVLCRARTGTGSVEGYAVTDGRELIVFAGTSYRYTIPLPGTGVPLHPTLDCNRRRPGSGTGILYVATDTHSLAAIVVDSPGLDPNAPWPKYQRTAGNVGNTATSFALNPGCP